MDPVDEYARLKTEVRRMQDRLEILREGFLRPGARLRSNQFEVQVRRQKRRVFLKDRLPPELLADPRYWEERENEVVTFRPLDRMPDRPFDRPHDRAAAGRFAAYQDERV